MAVPQATFLQEFRTSFSIRFGQDTGWSGGQSRANTAGFVEGSGGRRPVGLRRGERFELGDAVTKYGRWTIVVEFESKQLSMSNLLKYWPYIRGELSSRPNNPIILCHFSDWWSYATYRDLWEWTLSRMRADSEKLVDIQGRQFDHWDTDIAKRSASLANAMEWLATVLV